MSTPKRASFLERNVPIPGKFYVNNKEEDLLATKCASPLSTPVAPPG